jgi:hypothetical protein
MTEVLGLAPYLHPARPRSPARWWAAAGTSERELLRVATLEEGATPPSARARTGLAAPCSLPGPFLDFVGARSSTEIGTPLDRLLRQAREFAAGSKRGHRHPLRLPSESLPSLDRRRLPLFVAALPLLKGDASRRIFEVDPPAVLRAIGLPHTELGGDLPAAVDRRARILAALCDGALGHRVECAQRDYAIASLPALFALLACSMAARVESEGARPPVGEAAWNPLP